MQENAAPNRLIDTSILVDLFRGSTTARAWVDSTPETARFVSVITVAELFAGCKNRAEQRAVERELESYSILWVSESISQTAIESYKRFRLSHGVGFLDCLIAATAREHGLNIATLNTRHFTPLPNLKSEKPY